ncbi:hypothetical protein M404DRAFT_1003286 [Pisolithus tinctorius Marx 270]|uniref:Uncharacterized protein n=1 Tax=Pisolithus tinctorius Marx 270 TaxID=870435 RepID=A0A0C3NJ36_PISTI|nr:hypothetical protein M404DRAFT_1003286 [Pisolithus tinctorius Marx 270]
MALGRELIVLTTAQIITREHCPRGRRRDSASFERADSGDDGYDGSTRRTILLPVHLSLLTQSYSYSRMRRWVVEIAPLSLLAKG